MSTALGLIVQRMPDALSKTVPIWYELRNRLREPAKSAGVRSSTLLPRISSEQHHQQQSGTTNLYLPPNVVSSSERAQTSAFCPAGLIL